METELTEIGLPPQSYQISTDLGDQLFDYLRTWRMVCVEADNAFESRFTHYANLPCDAKKIRLIDFQYIVAERVLVDWLQGNPASYREFQAINRKLWHCLFEKNTVSTEKVIKHIKAYHHFFDQLPIQDAEDAFLPRWQRQQYLEVQQSQGDRVSRNLDARVDWNANILRFRRILLSRKRYFLGHLEAQYWLAVGNPKDKALLNTLLANNEFDPGTRPGAEPGLSLYRQLQAFVEEHQDYEYHALAAFFDQVRALRPPQVRSPRAANAHFDDWKTMNTRLAANEKELEQFGKLNHGTWEDNKVQENYQRLVQERELLSWGMSEREKQLNWQGKLLKWKEGIDFDPKLYYKEAGMLLLKSSGVKLAKAMANLAQDKEVDWEEIGKEVLIDLLQIGAMALATAFFGPAMGGSAASMLGGLLRPSPPDPYMEYFKEITGKLDKIDSKVDHLEKRLVDLLHTLPDAIRAKLVESQFKQHVAAFCSQLQSIQDDAADVLSGNKVCLNDANLNGSYPKMKQDLLYFLRLLWNKDFSFTGKSEFGLTPGTIIHDLIGIFQNDKDPQRLHETIKVIYSLVDATQAAVEHYHLAMAKLKTLLAVNFAFFEAADRKQQWAQLLQIQIDEDDNKALLGGVIGKMRNSVGENNARLYFKLAAYWANPAKFDFFQSFRLQLKGTNSKRKFLHHDLQSGTWKETEFPLTTRLYLQPDAKAPYEDYTLTNLQAEDFRKPLPMKIALGFDDTVEITLPGGKQMQAKVHFLEDDKGPWNPLDAANVQPYRLFIQKSAPLKDEKRARLGVFESELQFFEQGEHLGLKIQGGPVASAMVLLQINKSEYAQALQEERICCMAHRGKDGVFEIGFGMAANPLSGTDIKPIKTLRLAPDRIVNEVPVYGAFDYVVPIEKNDRQLDHILLDNLRLFAGKNCLFPGQVLRKGDSLHRNGNLGARLTFQSEGNLVHYSAENVALWHSNTHGQAATHATMQSDGNFVIYNVNDIKNHEPKHAVWAISWNERVVNDKKEAVQLHAGSILVIDNVAGIPKVIKDGKASCLLDNELQRKK